jgi:hypothetical protein
MSIAETTLTSALVAVLTMCVHDYKRFTRPWMLSPHKGVKRLLRGHAVGK